MLGVVGGGPFQCELHDSYFRKRRGGRRAAKMTPVEDGRIGRVAESPDYSCATILGSRCSLATSVGC